MTTGAMCGKNSEGVSRLSGKRLFIYGAGGLGREVLELARQTGIYEEISFLDDYCTLPTVNGAAVYTLEGIRTQGLPLHSKAVVATGEPQLLRKLIVNLEKADIPLESVVHPSVYVPDSTQIQPGVIVQDRVFLGPNIKIGKGCCIYYSTALGHDVAIGAYSHISMGCMIAGHVNIGSGTYIGAGAVIRNQVTIGKNCIIGMGSMVTKDIPDNVVAYGSPCRVVRENTDGKVFR